MPILAIIFLAISFLLALAVSWAILIPFFESASPAPASDSASELLIKKDVLLDALEDLEQDFHAAKLEERDYEDAKKELTSEAGAVLSQIENQRIKQGAS